ncbi:MAG: TIM44-like domain-containing protein [Kofleriaceae bacterium]|nr:TIM44-like domain-containing protein [Kofleriaceae bacterium]MBP6837132.1 TIM44-like domain-containing protein [Kofleriaceae bacterium]
MSRRARLGLAVLAAGALVAALAGLALARPGGGDSYSGGGGHGGGGGGDGEGVAVVLELLFHLIRLCFYYPKVGLPLLAIVIAFFVIGAIKRARDRDWDSGPPVALAPSIDLGALRRRDPDFSPVVFEDFVYRLFAAAHRARASEPERAALAPYVGPSARRALAERAPVGQPVSQVVIGAMRVVGVQLPPEPAEAALPGATAAGATSADGAATQVEVTLEFEANVMAGPPGKELTYYSVETWWLARAAGVTSRPPDPTRRFPCPNCGAPWQATSSGTQVCAFCGEAVDNGRFDWVVRGLDLRSLDERPPTLTTEVTERGTDLPTYNQRGFDQAWLGLVQGDPSQTDEAVLARVHHVYAELMAAWPSGSIAGIRGLISDGLADYLQYWLDSYARQGLRNELTDMHITHAVPCKLSRDRYYDALTVRIYATGRDTVVRVADGTRVKGDPHRPRPYSEYWTFIRSARRRGPPRTDKACANCGAPAAVSMAGACASCGAHVTAGEFDWVLSKIEQDDSYRG